MSAPGVLIIPGFADTAVGPHNMHVVMARALSALGCVVLRFDYRGQGESDGDFRDFTAQSGLADAQAALEVLRSQVGVDGSRLGIVGFSLGGALACALAASFTEVSALALLAPVAFPSTVFRAFFTSEHLEQAARQGWMDWLGWTVGRDYLPGLATLEPLAALQHSRAKALVVHGSADSEVPLENAAAYARQGAVLHLLPGGDHQFSAYALQEEAIRRVCAWFQACWKLATEAGR